MYAEYYNNVLYPLQDKAIEAFKGSPFYLTGGTTLSRGYYLHRFSDDLDYFLNDHAEFQTISERCIENLFQIFDDVKVIMAYERFYRIVVANRQLKIELINDVPSHIGQKIVHPVLGLIDSKENILANKITAIVDRCMPKDIVDIYYLLKDGLSIRKALTDVKSKAAGIVPIYVAKVIAEYDYSLLDTEIKWVTPVDSSEIKDFLTEVAIKIVKGTVL
ncbi:MAG: nucleotidyl transferase AbiEii/AbiGii toxin family protein [Thermodesulfovibrionales bacterium]|nr:nucleotidyl transferase AbiEii/AbiGii toxin family protein [Thermodesulfovibrionales bacterium]